MLLHQVPPKNAVVAHFVNRSLKRTQTPNFPASFHDCIVKSAFLSQCINCICRKSAFCETSTRAPNFPVNFSWNWMDRKMQLPISPFLVFSTSTSWLWAWRLWCKFWAILLILKWLEFVAFVVASFNYGKFTYLYTDFQQQAFCIFLYCFSPAADPFVVKD